MNSEGDSTSAACEVDKSRRCITIKKRVSALSPVEVAPVNEIDKTRRCITIKKRSHAPDFDATVTSNNIESSPIVTDCCIAPTCSSSAVSVISESYSSASTSGRISFSILPVPAKRIRFDAPPTPFVSPQKEVMVPAKNVGLKKAVSSICEVAANKKLAKNLPGASVCEFKSTSMAAVQKPSLHVDFGNLERLLEGLNYDVNVDRVAKQLLDLKAYQAEMKGAIEAHQRGIQSLRETLTSEIDELAKPRERKMLAKPDIPKREKLSAKSSKALIDTLNATRMPRFEPPNGPLASPTCNGLPPSINGHAVPFDVASSVPFNYPPQQFLPPHFAPAAPFPFGYQQNGFAPMPGFGFGGSNGAHPAMVDMMNSMMQNMFAATDMDMSFDEDDCYDPAEPLEPIQTSPPREPPGIPVRAMNHAASLSNGYSPSPPLQPRDSMPPPPPPSADPRIQASNEAATLNGLKPPQKSNNPKLEHLYKEMQRMVELQKQLSLLNPAATANANAKQSCSLQAVQMNSSPSTVPTRPKGPKTPPYPPPADS